MGIKNKWSNFPTDKVTLKMSAVIACELVQQKELSIMGNVRAELSLTSEAHWKPLFGFEPGSWGQHTSLRRLEESVQLQVGFWMEKKQVFSDLHLKASGNSHERKGQTIMFLPLGLKLLYSCGASQHVSKCHRRRAPTSLTALGLIGWLTFRLLWHLVWHTDTQWRCTVKSFRKCCSGLYFDRTSDWLSRPLWPPESISSVMESQHRAPTFPFCPWPRTLSLTHIQEGERISKP